MRPGCPSRQGASTSALTLPSLEVILESSARPAKDLKSSARPAKDMKFSGPDVTVIATQRQTA
ncbi:hypothetical protein E2562_012690 [Oryza meyeriana var. granulata]|uniref:Uncharacterized protein n=1 Tax=Oryza meyeriana var. granulata TaxID=110450 RepID=A0A6G1CFP0_9ORYZ|nr:hypothetical protein E2562_012690 [Oryza meyeriana var. granulata]